MLTPTFANIKRELTFVMKKFCTYVYSHFVIADSDHKPLKLSQLKKHSQYT